jgi:hypothetical protein
LVSFRDVDNFVVITQNDDDGVVSEKVNYSDYPITLYLKRDANEKSLKKRLKKEVCYELRGYCPSSLLESANAVQYLPAVIESIVDGDIVYHLTVLVVDFGIGKVFLYDPNGKSSRYSNENVHLLMHNYVQLINETLECYGCGFHKKRLVYSHGEGIRMNKIVRGLEGHNCVLCCIIFMLLHKLGLSRYEIESALCQETKFSIETLRSAYIHLFNILGNELTNVSNLSNV